MKRWNVVIRDPDGIVLADYYDDEVGRSVKDDIYNIAYEASTSFTTGIPMP